MDIIIWNFTQGTLQLSNQFSQKNEFALFLDLGISQSFVGNKLITINGNGHNHTINILIGFHVQYQIYKRINSFHGVEMIQLKFGMQILQRMNQLIFILQIILIFSIQQQYKQDVTQGFKIYFMEDQQFLLVTKDKNIDQILIFQLQDGVFKLIQDKTIQ
ncbi:unnamed protein product [Paramecium pentaurelia]|uniref:Uncharacterized protein n=1 Tax=Paramecium pentaurelia TaxID=43138 RepID=A0A8S1U9F6_9CILI|nr:unnamed protein product [Paramecium pentaurelia]